MADNSEHPRAASPSSPNSRSSQAQISEPLARRASSRLSHVSNPNIFSDEYALESIDTNHRAPSPTTTAASLHSTQYLQQSISADNDDPFADSPRPSVDEPHRSSLQKGLGLSNRDSFSFSNNPSFPVQRNHSVSSRFSIPRAMSPYTGATGPSHPYAMYSQVGVSRPGSIASVSTVRPVERPLGETSGPQHPYGMYSQNVVEEDTSNDVIPVGFATLGQPYQQTTSRRLDDVGDIIGPDGHAEPLPPYSRYPAGIVPKPPGEETTTPGSDISLVPEDQQLHSLSREAPISETSSRALIPETSGDNGLIEHNEPRRLVPLSGVMVFEEKLKQKGKKRVCCGLPVWTLVLIATVMLIGGCIGGVIGGILGTRRAAEAAHTAVPPNTGPHIVTVTATPALGYSEITGTPTNIQSVPTGYYYIPTLLQNQSGFCVEDHDYKAAWACQEKASDFEMYLGNTTNGHYAVFEYDGPTTTFTYGAQSPLLPSPTQNLSLAFDTSDTGLGPALFFYTLFDKLIILPKDTFSSSTLSSRSFSDEILAGMMERKQVSKPGDEPWFCWWNSTMMEFFLYINQTTSHATSSSTASSDLAMSAVTATSEAHYKNRRSSIADYPRHIKIEERRDYAGAEAPYCQQMSVELSGIKTIDNSVITIKEVEPSATTTYGHTSGSSQTYTAHAKYASPCYCLSSTDD